MSDTHGPSDHERELEPIGRRYRSIPSYAGDGIRRIWPSISATFLPRLPNRYMFFHSIGVTVADWRSRSLGQGQPRRGRMEGEIGRGWQEMSGQNEEGE